MTDGAWLVVGLGNPGPAYAQTRHNAGYAVVELLAHRMGGRWRSFASRRADVVTGRIPGVSDPLVLGRPRSYMNESGGPVSALAGYYKVPVERIVAVHDELDLDFGVVRLKRGGGNAGHNGLRSLIRALGSSDFLRVRLGIGRPPPSVDASDYVLSAFTAAQRRELPLLVEHAADAVQALLRDGLAHAQQQFHSAG